MLNASSRNYNPSMPVSPARAAAFDILLRVEQRQAYAAELLNSARTADLSSADRALCMELVMGVLRWRSRLDCSLAAVVSTRLEKLDPEVLAALRLAAYQLEFLRVPARAAVHESVELVKRARKRSAAPLVNAALRKLGAAPPALAPTPETALGLSQKFAHPAWMIERWAERFGLDNAERICEHDQRPAPQALRLRAPTAEVELRREGILLEPGRLLTSARRISTAASRLAPGHTSTTPGRMTERRKDLSQTRAYLERRIAVQDEASQLVALLVGRGERILDCCAAPGGKTAILAEKNPGALLVAADLHPQRAQLLRRLAAPVAVQPGAAGAARIHVLAADALHLPFAAKFDRVLADVPCSGTGTLARNPEIKWRLKPEHLAELHALQVAILRAALDALAPGGRLVYSTCSLEPEENERVVEEALVTNAAFHILPARQELQRLRDAGELAWSDLDSLCDGPFLRTLPGVHPGDGFFAAIVDRSS